VDLFPTLVELCGLQSIMDLEGESLVPLLRDPQAPRERPALTTFGQHNHSVRSQDWRYTVYADDTEELYDHRKDPHEFHNLAADPKYADVIAAHRRWLPQLNLPMAPGSRACDAKPGSPADIDHRPAGSVSRWKERAAAGH
jgi:choline-sulfatase